MRVQAGCYLAREIFRLQEPYLAKRRFPLAGMDTSLPTVAVYTYGTLPLGMRKTSKKQHHKECIYVTRQESGEGNVNQNDIYL